MTNGRVKGDLFVGNNVYANGEELATNTALTDGLASKLDLAGGKILQIVRATDSSSHITTSTSYTDVTGLSVTITPQKSDSAIILIANMQIQSAWSTGDNGYGKIVITDSSNNVISGQEDTTFGVVNLTGTGTRGARAAQTLIAYATPATTSATTYKVRFRVTSANNSFKVTGSESTSQLYAIEVSA